MKRMQKKIKPINTIKKTGLAPGTLVFTGERKLDSPQISEVIYNQDFISEKVITAQSPLSVHSPQNDFVIWYDIRGLHDVTLIENIGKFFNIHYLILEDIANTRQISKIEEYDNGIFIVFNAITESSSQNSLTTEQISIFVGNGFVLSFQEDEFDQFELLRKRLNDKGSKIRAKKSDYLAYSLLDMMVDKYIDSINKIENDLYELENQIVYNPVFKNKIKLFEYKYQLLIIRKAIYPLREALSRIMRSESAILDHSIKLYIRDLYDHTHQVIDKADFLREIVTNLQETYSAELNNKTNHVIRLLTIISTIFIPLTFIAGIYGMNFENMPELKWEYGYYYCLGLMAVAFVGFLMYFKIKKWL